MKTPLQELIEHLETWMLEEKDVIDNPTKYDERLVQYANQMMQVKQHFVRLCKSLLEKEKDVMIDFAYKFTDEPFLEIAKWYDKQFNNNEK